MKTAAGVASVVLSLLATSALATPRPLTDAQLGQIVAGTNFTVTIEVSDTVADGGLMQDASLSNPWGLSQGPGTFLWVSDNNTGVSTLYDPAGTLLGMGPFAKAGLTVAIPDGAADPNGAPSPTGTVFTDFTNSTFDVTEGGKTGHALFLF